MNKIQEYWTLEDLFYNKEDLTGWDVLQWLRMRSPGEKYRDLGKEAAVIIAAYDGWKRGIIFVEGDKLGLREWRKQ